MLKKVVVPRVFLGQLPALFAPRPALLIYNAKDDCCFTANETLPTVYDPVVPVYERYGRAEHFLFHVNDDPGTHNYERDNRVQFYKFIERYFVSPRNRLPDEIPSDQEVFNFDELAVGLPQNNATFRSLALARAENSLRPHYHSREEVALALREVVRYPDIRPTVHIERESEFDELQASAVTFHGGFGPFYGLLLETRPEAQKCVLHIADAPLVDSLPTIRALAVNYGNVLAIEPLFLGDNRPGGNSSWQYAMALQIHRQIAGPC